MIEETGKIVAIDKQSACMTVEFAVKTSCNGCQSQQDCGTGAIARAFSSKSQFIQLPLSASAKVGDKVKVGMPENAVLGASMLMYLMPLATLLVSALVGQALLTAIGLGHEIWTLMFAFVCTAASLYWLKHSHLAKRYSQINPRVLALNRNLEESISVKQTN